VQKYEAPSHKLGTARATSHTAVPTPRFPFAAFLLPEQAAY